MDKMGLNASQGPKARLGVNLLLRQDYGCRLRSRNDHADMWANQRGVYDHGVLTRGGFECGRVVHGSCG